MAELVAAACRPLLPPSSSLLPLLHRARPISLLTRATPHPIRGRGHEPRGGLGLPRRRLGLAPVRGARGAAPSRSGRQGRIGGEQGWRDVLPSPVRLPPSKLLPPPTRLPPSSPPPPRRSTHGPLCAPCLPRPPCPLCSAVAAPARSPRPPRALRAPQPPRSPCPSTSNGGGLARHARRRRRARCARHGRPKRRGKLFFFLVKGRRERRDQGSPNRPEPVRLLRLPV